MTRTPVDALKALKLSLHCLSEAITAPHTAERTNASTMVTGLVAEVDWILAQLERAKEGNRTFAIRRYKEIDDG